MDAQVFAPGQDGSFRIPANKPKDWFSYPVRFQAVANTNVLSINTQIDAGSDFYLTAITQFSTIAATAATTSTLAIPQVTVLITDSGSNRQLMFNPVPLGVIAGDVNHPHRLIHPRLFLRNSNIQIQLTSIDAQTFTNIWINLEGFRIYA